MKTKIVALIVALVLLLGSSVSVSAAPVGGEFRVNTHTTGNQWFAAVAMDASGDFVITWESPHNGDWNVYAQRYDRDGNALGEEFQVNTYTTAMQRKPAVAMNASGNFVITWQSYSQDSSFEGVYAQRYDRT